eukprot:scaffold4.g4713.t1
MRSASLALAAPSVPPPPPLPPSAPGAGLPSPPSGGGLGQDDGAVDAVFVWVNTSDPRWGAAAANYSGPGWKQASSRGEVVLSLAAAAHYMPWLRRIWVVSMQQRFDLGLYSEEVRRKVSFVDHADIIPASNRPLFNSLAIELFLHKRAAAAPARPPAGPPPPAPGRAASAAHEAAARRRLSLRARAGASGAHRLSPRLWCSIPGLAERFVYLNDDMLMVAPLERRDAFAAASGRFKCLMIHWAMLHLPPGRAIPAAGYFHMYNNAKLLLESAKLGPVPKYGWHAGYFVTKEAWRMAWRLFGEQLAAVARNRLRIYAPLDRGGDINTPASASGLHRRQMLMAFLGIMAGLQEVDTTYGFQMLKGVPPNLEELLAAAGGVPPLAADGPPLLGAGSSPPRAAAAPGAPGPGKLLFLNFQDLNMAPADAFQRWCRRVLADHEEAFAPKKRGCLCASPAAVGVAC